MDEAGFEAVVTAYHGEIYRYLRRMGRRASEADDLSQETFLRAYRAWRALEPEANVRAWLFTIATNLSRNHYRGQKRRRLAYAAVSATASEADGAGPDRMTISRETGARVEAIVAQLPLKQRLAFIQRKIHGLEYDAIGASLQCSAETARAHVFQALRKIRRGLDHGEPARKESRA